MNTNLRKTIGQIVFFIAVTLALTALAPRAHAQGGIPLWTNRYNGPETGSAGDQPLAIAADSSGSVFVTGSSDNASGTFYTTIAYSAVGLPLWTNQYRGGIATAIAVDGSSNVVVTGKGMGGGHITIKYSNGGIPLWTNSYGLSSGDFRPDATTAIAVDGSGSVFVTSGSIPSGSFVEDFATVKYSAAGVALWTNSYNGPANGYDEASAIALDGNGDVIVTGFSDGGLPQSGGTHFDYATIKYSSAGVPIWTNRYNGPGNSYDRPTAVAVDTNGNVFVTGYSPGTNGFNDFATIKYSNSGAALWTNRSHRPVFDEYRASDIAVDKSGNVFVTGTAGAFAETVAYSNSGLALWTNELAGGLLALDSFGNVLITGYASPYADFLTAACSNDGVLLWTNRYNGPGNDADSPEAITVDKTGNVIVTGESWNGSNWDYVTIKYSAMPPLIHLAIERDGSGGLFLRYTGAPDVTYRLQRAASVTGSWTNLATNAAPASGLIEFHDTSPLPGQAFYRTVQP